MTNFSSGEKDGLSRLPSSISQICVIVHLLTDKGHGTMWFVIDGIPDILCLTIPNQIGSRKQRENLVDRTAGHEGLNISAPRSRSILPRVSNPGSDNCVPSRCIQFRSLGTGLTGKFEVTWDNTIASTFKLVLPWFNGFTQNCTTEQEALFMIPPIPSTWIYRCLHSKWSCCVRHSVTKDVEEPESSKACLN